MEKWAVIVPLSNEEDTFLKFTRALAQVLDNLGSGKVYLIVDKSSHDNTVPLCLQLSQTDLRFVTIWEPSNKHVVDAYLLGYKVAFEGKHEYIVEMDAGLSHDPFELPHFLALLNEGYACVYGSRFIKNAACHSPFTRRIFSKAGGTLSNIFLGMHFSDATSGFQAFHCHVVKEILSKEIFSCGHFFQTEIKYLMRSQTYTEVPIHYQSSKSSIGFASIQNALYVLGKYTLARWTKGQQKRI